MTPNNPMQFSIENWTVQARKGLMELFIINLLAQGELYGYDLVKQLAEIEGLALPEGTIYPLLSRMKRAGLVKSRLVESDSGPARKYYKLSARGIKARKLMNAYWAQLQEGLSRISEE